MIIRFSRRRSLGSWLIRFLTWSDWSHVEMILHNGKAIGATRHGVQVKAPECHDYLDVHIKDSLQAQINALSQRGKRYDWLGMVGWWFRRDWQKPNRWFCSELIAWALAMAGAIVVPPANRVTPGELYLILINFDRREGVRDGRTSGTNA